MGNRFKSQDTAFSTMRKAAKTGGFLMNITIASDLKERVPEAALGVLRYQVQVEPSTEALLGAFEERISALAGQYTLETIVQNPHIAATRQAYKAPGKSPHEYRNAAEAMLRRIVKGNGLYRINNVVDINNLISVSSGYSIGAYDMAQLEEFVQLRCVEDGCHYDGIGKSSVNIGHLPVLAVGRHPGLQRQAALPWAEL